MKLGWLVLGALGALLGTVSTGLAAAPEKKAYAASFACTEKGIGSYTARRAIGPIKIDGVLDESSWQKAERSPRFVDMVSGEPGWYDTRMAAIWDDENLYIGYWLEEPYVEAKLTERDSLIFQESDAEVFIDGDDTYYEFEVNGLGTIYEMFYIWQDAYKKGGVYDVPEFDILANKALSFGGDYDRLPQFFWKGTHPRGTRWAFFNWDFPGLRWAVNIEGKINDNASTDKGWTAEIAFPWKGMRWLAAGRSLPPQDGDTWRVFFGRFELLRHTGTTVNPAWVLSAHRVYDTHIPECFTRLVMSSKSVGER